MNNKIIKANIFKANVTDKTNWLFLKLENELGNIGWGEATLQGKEKEIFKISEQIFGLVLNKNYSSPYDLKKHLPFKNILEASLSSSIMQCLWDLQGKIEQKSIGTIFGKNHNKIKTYANFNRSTTDRSPKGIESKVKTVVNEGFELIKFAPFDEVISGMSSKEIRTAMQPGLERINVIRETAGSEIKLMIDCHWRFNYETTINLIEEIENLNLYWLECPIPETTDFLLDIKKIRSIANSKGIKLAGLEKKILAKDFESYIKAGAYDFMMPDIKYAGGPDELITIEKLFNKFNVHFSPHNPSGPVAHAHTLQVCSATNEPALMEYQYKETNYFDTLLEKPNPHISNGFSKIPEHTFGLGITINELELEKLNRSIK